MNILFLTLMKIHDFSKTGIYPDLISEFADHGHDIYVVSPCEQRNKKDFTLIKENGYIRLISALIPDYFEVGLIRKGISSLLMGKRFIEAIKNAIPDVRFDLILYSTPPVTFSNVIEKLKKRDKAYTYLLLKDIWPQGPIDIGVLSTNGLKGIVTRYFKYKEKKLYSISDFIGCMSPKNIQYIVEKSGIDQAKVEICPNSVKVRGGIEVNKKDVRIKNDLPVDKTIFIYGGNLGTAQGIDFIISCLSENEKNVDTFILIVGTGTEFSRLSKWFDDRKPGNSKLMSYLPQKEYMEVMAACDVGLIFLDHRFTIPNYPSRLLSYMEGKMPVLAATDPNTDVGTVIENAGFGHWCESSEASKFMRLMNEFKDKAVRKQMGEKGYCYLKEHYDVAQAYKIVMNHFV